MSSIERIAKIFRVLSEANRLEIIFSLEGGPKSVSQIIESTGLSQPLVSFHLKVLRESGLVVTQRKSTIVINALSDAEITKLIRPFKKYGCDQTMKPISMPVHCMCSPWKKEE